MASLKKVRQQFTAYVCSLMRVFWLGNSSCSRETCMISGIASLKLSLVIQTSDRSNKKSGYSMVQLVPARLYRFE